MVAELEKHPSGKERDLFAEASLRLGVLTLRQASGLLDADVVRHEGDRLLSSVSEVLSAHATNTVKDVATALRRYFDPNDGELPQRLNRPYVSFVCSIGLALIKDLAHVVS